MNSTRILLDAAAHDLGAQGRVMTTPPILLTIRETAALLRVSTSTIEGMLRCGDLPRVKMNYAPRILREDVDSYIAAHRIDTRRIDNGGIETRGEGAA